MKRILSLLLALLATSAMGADLRSAGIKGATTSTPCPGCVGENYTVTGSGTPSTGNYVAVVSKSLTAGTWLASGTCEFSNVASSTTPSVWSVAVSVGNSTSPDTFAAGGVAAGFGAATVLSSGGNAYMPTSSRVITLASTTTVYLLCRIDYVSVGSMTFGASSNMTMLRIY